MVDILVRDESMHGIPSSECAVALRRSLPDHEVHLATSPRDEQALLRDARIVVGSELDRSELDTADRLELFACCWAGVGHLDLDAFVDRGVAVTNASGVHGPNVAEHVLGWFLMLTRRLDEGRRRQERAEWRHFQAHGELDGSQVCVVGLGAIGQAIVDRLAGFGVETVGVRYTPSKGGRTDEVYGFGEFGEAVAGADYVALACPLSEETVGLVGEPELEAMSHDAILVNVARGPVVDTAALVDALRNNRIHAAGLDVTDPEPLPADHALWSLGNAYITPHNAGHTPHYWTRVADILAENVRRMDRDHGTEELRNQVV